jgi:tetratricopeptide (TPR) repeat protein
MTSPQSYDRVVEPLARVLANAPVRYPMREVVDGKTVIRSQPGVDGKPPSTGGAAAPGRATGDVVNSLNTYPLAAFVLGSNAIEAEKPEVALFWLDKGLALQPTFLLLVNEKAAALNAIGRSAESLPLLDRALADDQQLNDTDGRARALRARGYALIELKRWDEAETAYRDSLTLDPAHCGAFRELGFIAQNREKPNLTTTPTKPVTSEQARAGCTQT